jgi:titin
MYQISLSWEEPLTGGDPITDYRVYWEQAEGVWETVAPSTSGQTNFIKELGADGSDAGKSYFFKVSAVNTIGESDLSEGYLVVAATIPDMPTLLTRNEIITTKTTLSFTWSVGVSDGGSPVIDYRVQYDQSMDVWVEVATSWTSQYFTTTYLQPITPGSEYKFKVESRNAVGYSDES